MNPARVPRYSTAMRYGEPQKIIFCILPKGQGMPLVEFLAREHGLTGVDVQLLVRGNGTAELFSAPFPGPGVSEWTGSSTVTASSISVDVPLAEFAPTPGRACRPFEGVQR